MSEVPLSSYLSRVGSARGERGARRRSISIPLLLRHFESHLRAPRTTCGRETAEPARRRGCGAVEPTLMPSARALGPGGGVSGERRGAGVGNGGMRSPVGWRWRQHRRDVVGERGGAGHRAAVASRSGGGEGRLVRGDGQETLLARDTKCAGCCCAPDGAGECSLQLWRCSRRL